MGIIQNAKQAINNKLSDVAERVVELESKGAALSPSDAKYIADRRDKYFEELSEKVGEDALEKVDFHLGEAAIEIHQAYLPRLKNLYLPLDVISDGYNDSYRIRYFDITKWVFDAEEKNIEKLINVYESLDKEECNIALIYHRGVSSCKVTLAVVNCDENQNDPTVADSLMERLKSSVDGNFPGAERTEITKDSGHGIPSVLKHIGENKESVAIVSNIATEKSDDFISQSIEKILDGVVPKKESEEYTIVLLARPNHDIMQQKNRLYELYTKLAPYAQWQISTGVSETETKGATVTAGANGGLGFSQSTTKTLGLGLGVTGDGVSLGVNASKSKTHTISENFGLSFSRSANTSASIGTNENLLQTYSNFGVKHSLEIIENQLKRIEEAEAMGQWEFAAYFVSKEISVANNVAHMYLALTQGDNSYLSTGVLECWDGERASEIAQTIGRSIKFLQHPVFCLKKDVEDEELCYPLMITPTTNVSGKELARALNFPRKSIVGLPVIESVAFGRDIQRYSNEIESSKEIKIGHISHMRHVENNEVMLQSKSLTSHTFITGSTGTGKTTATLQLINEAKEIGAKFMVVEPIKGEYKTKIGEECAVFGTNISCTSDLLKINPFWFPKNIHVLEHIDRFIEILNACWPMYAAMPAVLKDAVERAYVNQGWDLKSGEYHSQFPTFYDLLETLPEVMDDSMYSGDTKSDYAGALITRIKSLTNGLNGTIFCDKDGISEKELFEQNVIVDLSRIGSVETKSLIMGILIMKLQEFWINKDEFSKDLKHLTVLEEAHNILKRTSTSQSQEGSNMQGKSVEMITNAIAEMRAYGEGFVIADQAPNLLDEAVIRNTNTKILLRLPDADDRNVVGKACSLTDRQIDEIGKLPDHTAVVYQNDWIEAVLCYFDDFKNIKPYRKENNNKKALQNEKVDCINYIRYLFDESIKIELSEAEKKAALVWVDTLCVGSITKRMLKRAFIEGTIDRKGIAYNMFHGKAISKVLEDNYDESVGIEAASKKIRQAYEIKDDELIQRICWYIIIQICELKKEGSIVERYKDIAERRLML